MEKLVEFNCVIYLSNPREDLENEKLQELGIEVSNERQPDEKIVTYSFEPSNIVEIRETFIKYNEDWHPAVVVTTSVLNKFLETPPLLISYQEFKEKIK